MFINKIVSKYYSIYKSNCNLIFNYHQHHHHHHYYTTESNKITNKWGGGILNRPLSGLRVLDLSRVLAGPWSSQLFGDLGADVIKVENVGKGDDTRQFGPPFYKDSNGNKGSAYFSCANRNKRSIAIDISSEKGQDIVTKLALDADVIIENFKVGGLKKYKLDYNSISNLNPSIIYCSITGFGQSGPYSNYPGYDFSVQAMGGLIGITGDEDNPYKCGVAIVDIMTGLYANVAIQAALHNRYKTGKGQYIDLSLLDVQSAFLANHAANYLLTGENSKRVGNSHPSISPYDSLKTKDGFIVVAVGNNSQFTSMCKVLNLNHLPNDPLFNSNPNRVANRKQLLEILTNQTLKFNTEHLDQLLSNSNVPSSPINTLDKVYNHKQIKHRNMVWNLPLDQPKQNNNQQQQDNNSNDIDGSHSSSGNNNNNNIQDQQDNIKFGSLISNGQFLIDSINMVGNPIHFSDNNLHTAQSISENLPPPSLGQHTDEILKDILSLSDNEINQLKENKIVQ